MCYKNNKRCSIWGLLAGCEESKVSGVVLHDVREINSWVMKLLQCPVPTAGKNKVTLELLPPSLQVFFVRKTFIVFFSYNFSDYLPIWLSILFILICFSDAINYSHSWFNKTVSVGLPLASSVRITWNRFMFGSSDCYSVRK